MSLFKNTNTVVESKTQKKVASLKQDYQPYSNLIVACKNLEGDLEEFFTHGNHAYSPPLSIYGETRSTNKSDTIKIFENLVETPSVKSNFTAEVLDDATVVQALVLMVSTNFGQYCSNEITAYLFNKYCQSILNRVDIVFDIYLDHSIKNATRNKRGCGKRIKVAGDKPIPKHGKSFLCVNENKAQLFQLLAAERAQQAKFKQIVTTKDTVIVTNIANYLPLELTPCNQEEADAVIFVHVKELVLKGHQVVLVDTVDTNVVVIAIFCFNELLQFVLEKLWIDFGVGINKRWIPIHDLTSVLGIKSAGLLLWYAFTVCDAVSAFGGKGKLSAWTTCREFDDITQVVKKYSHQPKHSSQRQRHLNSGKIHLLCSRALTFQNVNECRRHLFAKQALQVDTIPPTKDALLQYIKRAVYQARLAQSFISLIQFCLK